MTHRIEFFGPNFDTSLRGFRRDMDRTLNELFATGPMGGTPAPRADIVEEDSGWTITVDMPGVKPADVEVLAEDRVLTVQGKRTPAPLPEGAKRVSHERTANDVRRQFRLPRTADLEQVTATFEDGVLTLRVAKLAPAQPRRVPVNQPVEG